MAGQRRRIFPDLTTAAVILVLVQPCAGMAGTQPEKIVPSRPLDAGNVGRTLTKSDRLLPVGNDKQLPVLLAPESTRDAQPSQGLSVLERMGAGLPDLPAEKTYAGKIDEAYGAFQRGLYLTAMNLALPKAQRGDPSSQTLVAELLNNGLGIKRNQSDAIFWYEQAAKAGDANAQFKFALMLMDGKLVKQDRKRADEMMEKAAAGGNPEAQFNIAQIRVAAKPGEPGLMEALPYYEKAAAKGVPDAQYALSQLYLHLPVSKEKRAEARGWLQKAASARFDTALYDMALWYINGIGGEVDYNKGFFWMQRAANRGHIVAMNKLAYLYINAIGTRPNPVEAAKWYVLSRRAGMADMGLDDFFQGIEDDQQQEAVRRADAFEKQ